jgi:hypothetical protein
MTPRRITLGQIVAGHTEIIEWLRELRAALGAIGYTGPINPMPPPPMMVNCGRSSVRLRVTDLCATLDRMAAWAEELRNLESTLDPNIEIPGSVAPDVPGPDSAPSVSSL